MGDPVRVKVSATKTKATANVKRADKERQRVAAALTKRRAGERDIEIPKCADRRRRNRCEKDVFLFLKTYWPVKYRNPWTEDQEEMIGAVMAGIRYGRDQAIAGPRSGGKTAIVEGVIVYALLLGLIKFPIIVAATGPKANEIFSNIKKMFERSELLAADYPEIVYPILMLERSPARGNMQTVGGEFTNIKWSSEEVVFPTTKGSKCGGSKIMTRGIDGEIRGKRDDVMRPDFVLIDDPETRESAHSDVLTDERERAIENDIAGLAGPGERLARVILCTIQNRRCLAYKFTDRRKKPGWNGKRFRSMVHKPDREDLWEKYLETFRGGLEDGTDPDGRAALQQYIDNRKEMERGSKMGNPARFTHKLAEDGSPLEISAIQNYYNEIVRNGRNYVLTELDNDPPEESGPQTSGLTSKTVRSRLNHHPQGVVPAGTLALTGFIDQGDNYCHWSIMAWLAGATGLVIDYGVEEVYPSRLGIDRALLNAFGSIRGRLINEPYRDAEDQPRPIDKVLVDAGNRDTVVYQFIRESGGNVFRPSKGFGSKHRQSPFNGTAGNLPGKRIVGNHWHDVRIKAHGLWLVEMDADHWKRFAHDRFLTPPLNEDGTLHRGSITLHGGDPQTHFNFSHHIVAEMEEEEFTPGKGTRKKWVEKSKNNHWLDTTYGNCVAADMCGVKLFASPTGDAPITRPATNWFASQRRR